MSDPNHSANLARVNAHPADAARAAFLKCCHTPRFADALTAARPFPSLATLLDSGGATFDTLTDLEIREAIAAHPRIGERPSTAQHAPTAAWSGKEQSGMAAATDDQRRRFVEGNHAYETRFGQVFLICATGRSATEMLAELDRRMANPPDAEFAQARAELRKITLLRLTKLLEGT